MLDLTSVNTYRVYQEIGDTYGRFETWLSSFIDKIDTDVMPGS